MEKHSEDLQQPETKWILPEDFKFLCFNTARELMTFNEPIPDYETRNDPLLSSALGSPRQSFDGILLYPTLIDQATILFYSLIKNHPFRNGNKRIAVMALLVFLDLNNKWLTIPPKGLYELACLVAKYNTLEKDFVTEKVCESLKKFLIDK